MPPKKQQAGNAFFYFMVDFKNEEEAKGVRFPNGMRDVSLVAGPIWKELDPSEKAMYERIAKDRKAETNVRGNKFTSQGVSFEDLDRREEAKKKWEEKEQSEVNTLIKQCCLRSQKIEDVVFYVIDVDSICKTSTSEYVPLEISLAKFSLADGVTEVLHTFIEAPIPAGYQSMAMEAASKHGISLPIEFGANDIVSIVAQIMDFTETLHEDHQAKHPVFTLPSKIPEVRGVLDWLCHVAYQDVDMFRVYDLAKMFYVLKNTISPKQGFPKETIARAELIKDVFNYCPGLGCDIDEANDTAVHCTKSVVKRWCYIICDHCCKLIGIQLEPGKHVPAKVDIHGSAKTSRAPSRATDFLPSDISSVSGFSRPSTQMSDYSSSRGPASTVSAWGDFSKNSLSQPPANRASDYPQLNDNKNASASTVTKQVAKLSMGDERSVSSSAGTGYAQVTSNNSTGVDFRRPFARSTLQNGLLFNSAEEEFPSLTTTTRGRGFAVSARGKGKNI